MSSNLKTRWLLILSELTVAARRRRRRGGDGGGGDECRWCGGRGGSGGGADRVRSSWRSSPTAMVAKAEYRGEQSVGSGTPAVNVHTSAGTPAGTESGRSRTD